MNGIRDAINGAIDSLRPECLAELSRLLESIAAHPAPSAAIKVAQGSVEASRKIWEDDEEMEDVDP
jgi:hypothetical protein